ncbi:MAG TPA: Type 1 glutamine amidotransferase-like domain-containing protein [Frankiaceae bacterium]|nr:Type 1 glutamine amidotransferase-like domain-containing protein [Frankiaceae bacterium]
MGLICLQGGNELTPACRDMDALLLDAAGGGPVAVLPLANDLGHEYDSTAADAVRHFTALGATDVLVADPEKPHEAASRAALLYLPGGSPDRLRRALVGTELGAAVTAAVEDPDRVVAGSSAGAMLLCAWTFLRENGMHAGSGLGAVPDFAVVPHYGGPRPDWEALLLAKGVDLLGIPEASGVLLDGENVTAVGTAPSTLITAEGREALSI